MGILSFLDNREQTASSTAGGGTLSPSVLSEVESLEGRVGQGFGMGRRFLLGPKGLGKEG